MILPATGVRDLMEGAQLAEPDHELGQPLDVAGFQARQVILDVVEHLRRAIEGPVDVDLVAVEPVPHLPDDRNERISRVLLVDIERREASRDRVMATVPAGEEQFAQTPPRLDIEIESMGTHP